MAVTFCCYLAKLAGWLGGWREGETILTCSLVLFQTTNDEGRLYCDWGAVLLKLGLAFELYGVSVG